MKNDHDACLNRSKRFASGRRHPGRVRRARGTESAAAGLRAAGYARYEAYSPYPVHGLYAVMGESGRVLPWLVLAGGIAGCLVALLLQWWTNAVDYPYWISGKPLFSLPANIPVTFELIILFGALAAFGGVIAVLQSAGVVSSAFRMREVPPEHHRCVFPGRRRGRSAIRRNRHGRSAAIVGGRKTRKSIASRTRGATFPALSRRRWCCWRRWPCCRRCGLPNVRYARKASPRIHLILDMDFQPKYLPQQYSPLFEDTRDMRPPVAGTVAVDAPMDNAHLLRGEVNGKPADDVSHARYVRR